MNVRESYNIWADQYDSNENKTRDLEATALRNILSSISFDKCLEIGCGTGKNTEWLVTKANQVTAVDLSENMLAKAKSKIIDKKVQFIQADITKEWNFGKHHFDLVTFSLVLEHIEDLNDIFTKLKGVVAERGLIYIGELHPFKQYQGTKARFETENGTNVLTCFNHNITDFTGAAKDNGFNLIDISEYFDNDDRSIVPRILVMVFRNENILQ